MDTGAPRKTIAPPGDARPVELVDQRQLSEATEDKGDDDAD